VHHLLACDGKNRLGPFDSDSSNQIPIYPLQNSFQTSARPISAPV
jgi:hypothetical protein